MKAYSIRQPWCWCILHANKDFENRNRPTGFRGNVLIHSSKEADDEIEAICFDLRREFGIQVPETLDYGGIVGVATFDPYTTSSESKWTNGGGYPISATQVLPFTPWKGALGFWEFPDGEYLKMLGAAIKGRHDPEGFLEYWAAEGRCVL